MPTYNLTKYSNNYSKTSGALQQYCRYIKALHANIAITDFNVANYITDSVETKEKITGKTGNDDTENVEIIVQLKYLSNSWRTFEIR